MSHTIFVLQVLSIFFLGMSTGSFLHWIIKKLLKKNRTSKYAVCSILQLTFAILLVTTAILLLPDIQQQKNAVLSEIKFFTILFAASALFSAFFKYLALPAAVLYGLAFFYTSHYLNINFTSAQKPVQLRAENSGQTQITTVLLPKKLLLPLQREWITPQNFTEPQTIQPLNSYNAWITANKTQHQIDFPADTIYPALFTISFTHKSGTLQPVLKKAL